MENASGVSAQGWNLNRGGLAMKYVVVSSVVGCEAGLVVRVIWCGAVSYSARTGKTRIHSLRHRGPHLTEFCLSLDLVIELLGLCEFLRLLVVSLGELLVLSLKGVLVCGHG